MNKKSFMQKLLWLAAALMPLFLAAQAPTQQSVKEGLELLNTAFPQERIYIHFDKPAYAPGETIWYKAYLMQGTEIAQISANIYVDLTDANGAMITHAVAPLLRSSANGNFDIPKTYTGKFVHVRAYTKWMLNFDSAFLYDKDVFIIQPKGAGAKGTVNKPTVQFFAEGGDCIAGINNKIAFKANYPGGRPFKIKGVVVNSKGVQVAEIKNMHDGMGYFYLEPQLNEKYTAKWKDDQGIANETPLPAVKKDGLAFEIKIAEGRRGFLIKRSENAPANFNKVHIIGTMHQQLVYIASVKLDAVPVMGGSIPTVDLPTGILQVTIFDSNWTAIAERITFINNDDYLFEPEVGFAALGLGKRGKNTLVINLPDSIVANLSVAVTDAGIGVDSSDGIIPHLLLTGDLKGNVYKPTDYFVNNSDSLQQKLDLVMLTNGWRRIKWDELVQGKMTTIKYPNDTAYLSLSGKVFGASAQDLRQSAALLVMILEHTKDTARKMIQSYIKEDGTFAEPGYILYDTTKIYYKLAGNKSVTDATEVSFNTMFAASRKIFFDKNGALYFSDSATENRNRYFADEQARLAKLLEGNTLDAVTVKAKTKTPLQVLDEKYASGLFSGGQATQFDVLKDINSRSSYNLLTYLQGKVAGLNITASNTVGGQSSVTWRGGTPSFFLDQSPVDISQLSNLSMSDVAYIKVFQPPFFGAFGGGANGAIAVYTQRGGTTDDKPAKSLPFKQVIGYTAQKEFYSPNYGTFDQRNDLEDLRSTLYWNPMIFTTKENHIIKLTFYNNDITHSFRVIAEGVTADGKLTHIEKVIE